MLPSFRGLVISTIAARWNGAAELREAGCGAAAGALRESAQYALHSTRALEPGELLCLERAPSHPVIDSGRSMMSPETVSHVHLAYGLVLSGSLSDVVGTVLSLSMLHPLRQARSTRPVVPY